MAKSELNKKTSEFLVTINIKGVEWNNLISQSEKNLLEKVQVKGFRKGKAPKDIALKQISKADIFTGAITKALDKAAQEAAKETKDLMVLDAPTYKVDKVDEKGADITFIYPVYPEIKLSDYTKLGVKYEDKSDIKAQVDAEKERIQNMATTFEAKDGSIAKGDTAVFDFVGYVDDEKFEGGEAKNHSLEIGSGQFIPGFEDQMVGLKAGEEKDIKVTFPKDYHAENLKAKDAIFKIKVNEVKAKKPGKLDDKYVKTMNIPEVDTVAKLDKYLQEIFKMQNTQQSRAKFQREAFDKILEETKFVIPSSLVAKEMQGVAQQMADDMKKQGITMEQYLKMTGMKIEQMNSQFKAQAEKRLQDALVFAEIAKKEKIELKDADYEAEYVKLAKVYNQSIDAIKGSITKQQMQVPMTNDKVIDILINKSK